MSKLLYPDFFNDVFAPIMQPGSSGSFAGTSRVGRTAHYTLNSLPLRAKILFNPGEHHMKGLGNMMDDRGYLGGLQDFKPDDIRLYSAHECARESGISYEFGELPKDNPYPGSASFELVGREGDTSSFVGTSIGGGRIIAHEVNGFSINWRGDTYGLLVWKIPEHEVVETAERLISRISDSFLDKIIGKSAEGESYVFLELSEQPEADIINSLREQGIETRVLPVLFPVVTTKNRKPQLFQTVEEWRQVAKERNISFVQAAIEYEKEYSGWSEEQIWDYFETIYQILHNQVHSLDGELLHKAQDTPMLPIYGKAWDAYNKKQNRIVDNLTNQILLRGFATNAKIPGVKIVPGPMGTGGGYLFSAIDAVAEARQIPHQKVLESLVVAAGLGALAYTHSNASGQSGCCGESGVCNAMGSGAVAWLCGGDGLAVEHAASMALQANLGIYCDPIPGGLEFPCITRTLRAAITAPLYADLALAGIDPLVPYHEVLQVLEKNFRETPPERLHGPSCGVCTTPTACSRMKFLSDEVMAGKLRYEA